MQAVFRRTPHVDLYCTRFLPPRDSHPEPKEILYLYYTLM